MDEQSSNKKMITTFGLVTMIITAIFGFGNVSNAYLQMGYGSIIWYALAGICFFFPCGLMMAEYGSTFKDAKGGIYSWLAGWLGNIAFATIMMSALGTFFPSLFTNGQNLFSIIVAIILTWVLTFLVNRGIESATFINSIGTICKIIPLVVFVICVILGFKAKIFTADFWGNVTPVVSAVSSFMPFWKKSI